MVGSHGNVILKKPEPTDMEAIKRWYSMTDNLGYATGEKDFSEIAEIIQAPEGSNSLVLIIHEHNNLPIGFTYANLNEIASKTILWIRIFLIDPSFQNKGYGTAAIRKLLDYAKSRYKSLTCIVSVSENNVKGLSFWERVGFSADHKLEAILHREGTSGVSIMKKEI